MSNNNQSNQQKSPAPQPALPVPDTGPENVQPDKHIAATKLCLDMMLKLIMNGRLGREYEMEIQAAIEGLS